MTFIYKILVFFIIFKILIICSAFSSNSESNFETWLSSYKQFALKKGISQATINIAFKNVKFLEQVIKYDRKQPEFFEDTITYVSKRANLTRAQTAKKMLEVVNNDYMVIDANRYLQNEIFPLGINYIAVGMPATYEAERLKKYYLVELHLLQVQIRD